MRKHRLARPSAVIDEAPRSLRIAGSVLLREAYAPPWAIVIPQSDDLATRLGVSGPVRLVAFHLVEFGHCATRREDGDARVPRAGEIAISFGGGAHRLSRGRPAKPQSISTLLAGGPNVRRPESDAGVGEAALPCGVFLLHHGTFNPLLAALPPVLYGTPSRPGELHNLPGVARLMVEAIDRGALGGGHVVERLLEVPCAEAIPSHIETVPEHEASWFRGIKDPIVGRAIAAVHERPGDAWSVRRLADDVAMSPSRFAARFSAAVGDSPMADVAKWRMSLACRDPVATRPRPGTASIGSPPISAATAQRRSAARSRKPSRFRRPRGGRADKALLARLPFSHFGDRSLNLGPRRVTARMRIGGTADGQDP